MASGWPWAIPPCAISTSPRAPCSPPSGLTEADVKPVLVPNVVRGADDFVAGALDVFFFAFGAPKLREVDATVAGIRAIAIRREGHAGGAQDHAVGLPHRRSVRARSSPASSSR